MLDALPRQIFHLLASSGTLKKVASAYGMRRESSFARRFVAGETAAEAIAVARALQQQDRMHVTLDLLGESVASPGAAQQATSEYLQVMSAIVQAGIERNISLKLTQLGLDIDRATATDNLRRVLDLGQRQEYFVRIDMESSAYTDVTLDIFETMWRLGYRNVGIVLQSALRRTDEDLQRINLLGARVRLVKGAYREPRQIAFSAKSDVDEAYVRQMRALLTNGTYPAIATHDPMMIEATKAWAASQRVTADRFEFQMLYGIRRDLQQALVAEGYRVRIYIPFGREWFPYFMRRLGERPANVGFVIRSLLNER